jgi:hypothetical protein
MSFFSRLGASLLALLLTCPGLAAELQWQGKPLRDYIDWLSAQDATIIYSSDLVRDDYRVRVEPGNADPATALQEAIAPYGLTVQDGPGGSLLVVSAKPEGTDGLESAVDAKVTEKSIEPELPEIIVVSSVYRLRYDPAGSHTFLDRDLTTKMPDVGDDAVRGIDRLPGTANGGVSTKAHIRGGSDNEQLFLFDGLRLYEPYHLKDFQALSTIIDQGAISGIDFYSAGYQVQYGDRMSGVVDISMREPPVDTTTELSLSFFNASVLSMGRFGGSNRGDWFTSLRRGNLDLIADAINSDYGAPRYQDAFLHIGWQFDRTYVSSNALLSYDKIQVYEPDGSEQADAKYQNTVIWLKAETDWSESVSSRTIMSLTHINNSRNGQTDIPLVASGSVNDRRDFESAALSQDWQVDLFDNWSLNTGFDIKRLEATYGYDSTLDIYPPFDQIFDNQPSLQRSIQATPEGRQYAVYLQSRWRLRDNLILDAGVRWDQQTYTTAQNDDQTSPRFNLLYQLGERTEFRLGFGRYYQAQEINELQVQDGIANYYAAQRARHLVASVSHMLTSGIDIRAEYYEKKYNSLMPRYENAFDSLVLVPELQIDRVRVDASSANARGAELMITGNDSADSLLWWLSYSWAKIEDMLPGGDVKRSWDQTHTVKAGINWDWKKWSFSAAGSVHTGWPQTSLGVESVSNPDGSTSLVATTSDRNAYRYSPFHTLDVRASRQFDVRIGELTGFIEITNLYNQENPCCTKYRLVPDADGNPVLSAKQGNWLPIVPSLGVVWQF